MAAKKKDYAKDLKSCPFCGKNIPMFTGDAVGKVYIDCWGCFARGPVAEGYTAAKRAWNKRAKPRTPVTYER